MRQERNIQEVATSDEDRSYRLKLPAARWGNPQDAQAVREAAFHLSAPTADAPAAWLDVRRTVQATVHNAGRLTLRWDIWREHRPMLFIEDVSPSMACWPGFGEQLAASMSRQGGDVERYFMNGTPAPRERIDRVWALDEVHVGADGTVRLDADLREALLSVLLEEKPDLLSEVVKWTEAIVVADLGCLEERSLGGVEARALLARLLLVDPQRRRTARRQLKRLGNDGFGEWAEVDRSVEETASRGTVRLVQTRRPRRGALAGAAVGALTMGLATASLLIPEWRELFFPPEPDFRVLQSFSITPESSLRFYDFYQLEDDVWMQVGQQRQRAQREPGEPTVWSLDWYAAALAGVAKPGTVELRLGYDLPLTEEPSIGRGDPIAAMLSRCGCLRL